MVAFHARAVLNQWEILGFYHSHPDALAVPSNADLPREIGDVAMQYGATWPEHCLLIASTRNGSCGEIRAWRLTANANDIETGNIRYEPLEIEIIAAQTQECRDSAGK